jgi:hypothetical protein
MELDGAVCAALHLNVELIRLDGSNSMLNTSVASCSANCRPMQARCPVPNGLYAFGGIALSRSGAVWSGLNSSASGPQTEVSRCSIGIRVVNPCPFGTA